MTRSGHVAGSGPGALSESSHAFVEDTGIAALKGEVSVKGVHFPLRVYAVTRDASETVSLSP